MDDPFRGWRAALDDSDSPLRPGSESSLAGLPPVFQFSQSSLQDFLDCERRFQLRHVLGQRWPAAESESLDEHEHLQELGSQFHLLVQRHLEGLPEAQLQPEDPDIARWWRHYLQNPPPELPTAKRLPEIMLSAPLGGQRLIARYDLLAIEPGERVMIVDWKTTKVRPPRHNLERRMQSRVYPFVLVEAGAGLFGGPLEPEQVSMIYWFAEQPATPEIFRYTATQHEATRRDLMEILTTIAKRDPDIEWTLTEEERRCGYCVYRSLCNRGVRAARAEDAPDLIEDFSFDFDFNLDDIDEIAF